MPRTLIECVPNFSEGRDAAVVQAIADEMRAAGAAVLHQTMDRDHHRSVITVAGAPAVVVEAAFRAVACAARLIDLRRHEGVHPRIGSADVVPLVPIEGITLEECAALAAGLGERIWRELGVPVYLYEAAARHPERRHLENIRRGNFEGLRETVRSDASRRPDFGGAELHPTAGATVVGARRFLIAYNINLLTNDVEVARRIARAVRTSNGGLSHVKAMGVALASRGQAQVSMNLTDHQVTPVYQVFAAVRDLAAREGIAIASSEIIGLVPRRVLEQTFEAALQVENFTAATVLENRLEQVLGQELH